MAYQTNLTPDFGYGNPYVDSLIWGCQWTNSPDAYGPVTISTPVDITYSYATGNLYGYRLSAWSIAEVNAFEEAMQFYENVCNLNFTLTTFTSEYEDQSNIVFYQVPENYLGAGYLGMFEVPDGTWTSNYGYFNYQHSSWRSLNKGSYGFITIIHELGHGLGLAHPHDGGSESSATTFPGVTNNADVGLYGLNQGIWTTMSYIDGWDAFASSTNDYGYQSTPMAFDVAALQAIYGVNTSFRTGSDTYYLPTSNTSGTGWSCIWDAGGTDTISNEGSSIDSTIELYAASLTGENAGGFVSKNAGIIGGFTIANGVVIENAIGGEGNDSITGNDANNQLQGGNGNDIMYGGGGNDTFDWDSAKRSGNDTIYGGLGDDTYVLDSSSDIVIEYLDEGTDAVWTDFSFSLTSCLNVEGLYLTGIGNITATGNNLSNLLRGNSGNNFLIGNEGLDTFIFNTNANGVDTISDIAVGEIIQILGANFSEAVTEGDGSSAGLNQIQIERSGGITTLNIGTDSVMGADTIILLTGNYRASQFFGSGQTITFSAYTNSLPTGAVSISGTARQGQVLTASNTLADIDGLGTITYQWRANGINISAATDPTYTLTQAEVGAVITVVARYTDPFGSAESVESGATASVTNVNDPVTGTVTISGTVRQGQVLTATNTLADLDGLGIITYNWHSNGTNISGANGSTYILSQTDVGKVITVIASYTDQLGSPEIVASRATASVANPIGSEVLTGTNSSETFRGGLGNDVIDGGAGLDYASFAGLSSQYSIQVGSNTSLSDTESGRDGTDSLVNVERLIFADTNIALDLEGIAGQAYRIYEAVLGRAPDLVGLGYWINDMDNGVSLTTIAQGFIASPEFQGKYGANPSYETYINLLYNNILERDPDTVGMNYWVSNMRNGVDTPAAVLASFSEGYENTANVAPDIANGIYYAPWIT
jgi:serralysin